MQRQFLGGAPQGLLARCSEFPGYRQGGYEEAAGEAYVVTPQVFPRQVVCHRRCIEADFVLRQQSQVVHVALSDVMSSSIQGLPLTFRQFVRSVLITADRHGWLLSPST